MKVIQLMVFLLTLLLSLSLIFLVVYLCFKKKKDSVATEIVKKSIIGKPDCKKCGANCSKFAEGLKNGEFGINDCPNLSAGKKEELKEVLDLKPESSGDKVAFVYCKGGNRASEDFNYEGVDKCSYMNQMYNGIKNCKYACLGCMDCAKVCPTMAIYKNEMGVAEIDRSMCIGCGECTKVCPDKLIRMIPLDQEIVTACKYCINNQVNTDVTDICSVGCTKCGNCVSVCPTGALYFKDDSELCFDITKCIKCHECVKACPNNTIVKTVTDFDKI